MHMERSLPYTRTWVSTANEAERSRLQSGFLLDCRRAEAASESVSRQDAWLLRAVRAIRCNGIRGSMRNAQLHFAVPAEVSRGVNQVGPPRRTAARATMQQELRGRSQQLRTSIRNPHPDSLATAEIGLPEWARRHARLAAARPRLDETPDVGCGGGAERSCSLISIPHWAISRAECGPV
jgi:hypothetical protein